MFEKLIHLSIFYWLYFDNKILVNMTEKWVVEDTDPDLEGGEYFRIYDDRYERWKEVKEDDNEDRVLFHYLRWYL